VGLLVVDFSYEVTGPELEPGHFGEPVGEWGGVNDVFGAWPFLVLAWWWARCSFMCSCRRQRARA
jgi:hypothetical protein